MITYNPEKTVAILFSLKHNSDNLDLYFYKSKIALVNNHKHLGVTFQGNGKWSCQIERIVHKTSKMINSLRKLKYLLNRITINKIYAMFIKPHFEYACEVWDGCTSEQSEQLEPLQLEAARIVTGLHKYTSREHLYYETGWEKLEERRRKRKLCLFYKIYNNTALSYLCDLLPKTVASKSSYSLRNSNNISTPFSRIKHSHESFFPSTIRIWN